MADININQEAAALTKALEGAMTQKDGTAFYAEAEKDKSSMSPQNYAKLIAAFSKDAKPLLDGMKIVDEGGAGGNVDLRAQDHDGNDMQLIQLPVATKNLVADNPAVSQEATVLTNELQDGLRQRDCSPLFAEIDKDKASMSPQDYARLIADFSKDSKPLLDGMQILDEGDAASPERVMAQDHDGNDMQLSQLPVATGSGHSGVGKVLKDAGTVAKDTGIVAATVATIGAANTYIVVNE